MKKNYLLILDLVINCKEYLSQNITNYKKKFSDSISTQKRFVKESLDVIQYSSIVLILFIFLGSFSAFSQVGTKFSARLDDGKGNKYLRVQGDIKLIGNTILTPKGFEKKPYNGTGNNNDLDAVYLDVDSDTGTFSSTSADLKIDNSCKKILWAGLYWSAMYPNESSTNTGCFNCGPTASDDWNKVKFKIGDGTYIDITANKADPKEVIFKGDNSNNFNNGVYVCFKDVTDLLIPLADADQTYTVANLRATTGKRRGGSAGGWSLVVIYESPTVSSKYISVFDGAQMTNVDAGRDQLLEVDIQISGFQTLPLGFPVYASIGVAALDGDFSKKGDGLLFKNGLVPTTTANTAFTPIRNSLNPLPTKNSGKQYDYANSNFFNASITVDNAQVTTRNPTSTNNLGFDIDYLNIPNPGNAVIPNGATEGTYRMFTDTNGGDGYAAFLTTFAVDIIEPKILLTKEVFDDATPPNNMGDKDVTLGQQLNYVIGFKNQGNDDATDFTITDILPINTVFVYPSGLEETYLAGLGIKHTYDAATRTIVFKIPDNLVTKQMVDPYLIRLKVKVVESCNQLSDACSNEIQNVALSSYSGTYNSAIFGDKSLASYTSCNLGIPQATNFLVGVDDCQFTQNEVLCGTSVVLTAADDYDSYKWSTAPFDNTGATTGTILGNDQKLTVTNPGIYYVYNTAVAPCLSITEAVTVTRFGTIAENPVIPFADLVLECPNDGKLLPNIFLCGANDFKLIKTAISDGSTIVWEKLNEGSCSAVTNEKCANENDACTWDEVARGSDYKADTSGQFRLTLKYPGGCFNRFYFNVYKNDLNPTETHQDIICSTKGNITIRGVGSDYEYSIDGTNYQTSNSFDITTAGSYTAYIRQVGIATNPCVFTISNIPIRKRNFTISTVVTNPYCFGSKGSIKIAANDGNPQYTYYIYDGPTLGNLVDSTSPILAGDHTFEDLTPGKTYRVQVTSEDGCDLFKDVSIAQPASELSAVAAISKPLTSCSDGEITVTPTGGTAPYYYFVDGSTDFQTEPQIPITTADTYTIRVVDHNNCETTTSVTVEPITKPDYNISNTNSDCYNAGGEIKINLTNANGHTMSYSIDNGVTFQTNPTFSNVAVGSYDVVVRYGIPYTAQDGTPTIAYCTDSAQNVVITGPASAITASAGVGELAGCDPAGTGFGKLRITNAQGGTPGYKFSFDGGLTWQDLNEKYVAPGTYTLAVKDSKGCVYQIPYSLTLDPKPADPTIVVEDPVFNCDGTATTTVTVTNDSSTNYTYEYYLDNRPNTPITNNVFTNVTSGAHTVSVKYNVVGASTYSNLLYEDFGNGADTTSPGINAAYCWEKQDGNTLAFANCSLSDWHPWLLNDGDYVVTKALLPDHFNDFRWILPKDHTAVLNNTPTITDGRFLAVNIGKTIPIGAVLYQKTINDVIPNQEINVSLYMINLLRSTNDLPSPQLTVQLVKGGTVIHSQVMPSIPRDEIWHSSTDLAGGTIFTLNPGDNTSLEFQVISNSTVVDGNDLAIDDIHVYQLPKSCLTPIDFPIIIDTNKAFEAEVIGHKDISCAGADDGEITIAVQNFATTGYYYSVDGKLPFIQSTTSPLVVSGLSSGNHSVSVQYDLTASPCLFPLSQEILTPEALTVAAIVTVQPTCITGATIIATGSGGTPAYQFELRKTDDGSIVIAFQTGRNFANVPSGDYTVFVKDANLCVSAVGANVIVTAPTAPVATIVAGTNMCFDPTAGATIVVNVSDGTGPFSYQTSTDGGTTFSGSSASFDGPTFTYNATATGSYIFRVTDANGCVDTTNSQIINAKLTAGAGVTTALDCDLAPDDKAVITGTISGGTAPFTVVKTAGAGTTTPVVSRSSFTFTTVTSGAYTFEIKDAMGCTTTTSATINALVAVTAKATVTDVSCFGAANGSVILEALTGVAPYTFEITGQTATSVTNTTAYYSGLAGSVTGITYNYTVTDAKGCIFDGSFVVKQPAEITASASITIPYTCDGPATITAIASNGNGSFTYTLIRDGIAGTSNNTGVFDNLSVAGIYQVSIADAKGCPFTVDAGTIVALNPPTAMTISNSALTCPSNKANVTITNVTNSAGVAVTSGLEYRIVLPTATAFQPDNSFTDLDPGIQYTFEVKDANNCTTFSKPYTITPLPVFTVGSTVVSDVQCLDTATGEVNFTVSNLGNEVAYSYTIDGVLPATTGTSPPTGASFVITVPNLAAGTHTIIVTNTATTCFVSDSETIAAPTAALSLNALTPTPVTCNLLGTAVINAVGGWGTNTYVVTGTTPAVAPITQNTNTFNNLAAGDYTYTVTDLKGCQVNGTFTIADKVAIVATIDATSTFCAGGAGATIVVSPENQPNYTYTLGGVTNSTGTFTGITPGDYTIRVRDTSTGCYIDLTVPTIAQPISAQIRLDRDLSCISGSENAIIEVTISNGYPDYTYLVNTTGAPFSGTPISVTGTPFTYPVSSAATYYFEITDSQGCKTVVSRTINALVPPTLLASSVAVKCKGEPTGTITVTPTPATGSYTYVLTPTAPTTGLVVTQTTSNVFNNVPAGTYSVVIIDAKSCASDPVSVIVDEPLEELTATAEVTTLLTCDTNNNPKAAIITVMAIDGTPYTGGKYKYDYGNGNGFVDSNTFTTNTPGDVTITVKDANGCTTTATATVNTLNPPSAVDFAAANVISCTVIDTDLTLTVTKGVAPFRFEITSTDAAIAPTAPIAPGVLTQDHTFVDLAPGTYFFKVTDANNCTITGNYTIDPVKPITVSGALDTAVSCNGANDGKIKYTVSGYVTGGYTYTLVGNVSGTIIGKDVQTGNSILYSALNGGENYTFTVTNTVTKCVAIVPAILLTQPAAITALAATATKVFCTQDISTIRVTATGGSAPLQFAVVKSGVTPVPADYNTTGVFTKDTSVDGLLYDAYVMDSKGACSQDIPVTVVRDAAPNINAPAVQCYPGFSFDITVGGTVYGGTPRYGIGTTAANISYNNNATKTITAPGTYYIGIKDDNNCTATTSFIVNDQLTLTAILDKDITCNFTAPATSNEAQITLTAGGGNGTYTYEYTIDTGSGYVAGTIPFVGNVLNTSDVGNYIFKVTSGGCTYETTIAVPVTTPVNPTATHNATNLSCFESADGTVTLVPLTGATPFTYNFNNLGFTSDATYSNLAASTGLGYPYIVRDAKGCEVSGNAIVTQPAQIIVDYTTVDMICPGPSLGSVTVLPITNGVAPYTYELRNKISGEVITTTGQPGNVDYLFDDLSYGDFILTVTDFTGCSNFRDDVKIIAPPNELDIDLTTPIATCATGATIVVAVNPVVTPAAPLYEFGIYNNSAVAPFTDSLLPPDPGFPLQHTFNNLTPGVVYTFVVYDPTTNCYYFETAAGAIAPLTTLTSVANAVPVVCKGGATGGVSITIDDSSTDATQVNYEIFFDQSDISTSISGIITMPTTVPVVATGLLPGTYYIKFTEVGGTNDGCTSSSVPFVVTESAVPLTLTAVSPINDNCKTDAGQVVATPNGGTGPFTYIINQSATAPLVSDTWGASNANIFNVQSGSYYVWVKDANNCIQFTTVIVDLDPEPDFTLAVPNLCTAEGAFAVDVTITDATPTMAPYSVSVNGGGFVPVTGLTYQATGLNSGLQQSIIVKNKNNCPVEHKIDIIATPLATAVVTKVLDCSVTPTAVADATITVTISKGTLPYTYQVYKNNVAIGAPVTLGATDVTFDYPVASADADTYKFAITDVNNCPIETNEVIIDPIVPIVPGYTPTQPLCFGDANGEIDLSTTVGGQGNYTYTLQQTAPIAGAVVTQTTPVFKGLTAGDYTYTITDELGCTETATATLLQPSAIAVGAPVITGLTCGAGNIGQAATVVLSGAGGSGSYEFSFNGSAFSGQDTYTVEDTGADQTIPYIVKDINGCEIASDVTILKLDPPTDFDLTQGPVITCAQTTTTVTISNVINGAGSVLTGLTYQIIAPLSAAIDNGIDPVFTGLLPDVDYVFQVKDENGCVFQKPLRIDNVINISIVEQSTTGLTCYSAIPTVGDGKATFFVSGFAATATYHYEVDGIPVTGNFSSPTINLTGLTVGPHRITVYDDVTGCDMPLPFTIAAPTVALAISKVVTPLGCTTFGAVTITATDGWGYYTYSIVEPISGVVKTNNTGVFGGLTEIGIYAITVSDANGCVVTDTFTFVAPTPPTATIAVTSDYCYDSTDLATLVVTPSGGAGGYEFSIDNGQSWQTSNTFSSLTPGSYDITVKDAYGCEVVVSNNVIEPQLFASAVNTKDIFCTVGSEDGTIRVSALGGYPTYGYTVTIDGTLDPTVIPFTNADYSDYTVTGPGSYVFTVSDTQGCSYTTTAIVMVDPTQVLFTATPTSPSCVGIQGELGDGSILVTLDPSNDNPDYTYTIQRTLPTTATFPSQSTPLFTGLIAGTYEVTVTSARGCSHTESVEILPSTAVTALALASAFTCSPTNTLNATVVTVTGGGGAGTDPVADYVFSANETNWRTENTFEVIDNGDIQNLTYYVKDAKGCIAKADVTIAPFPTLISATTSLDTQASCANSGVETIKVDIVGGATPTDFEYQVSDNGGAFSSPATAITAGDTSFTYGAPTAGHFYQFKITDKTTGCSILSDVYDVPLYNKMKVIASTAANVDCNSNATGAIEINIVDYAGAYNYEIYNGASLAFSGTGNTSTNPFVLPHGLVAGTDYKVVVTQTDYPSCTVTSTPVIITEPTPLLNNFIVNVKNKNCNTTGAVLTVDVATIVGGTAGYTYAFVTEGTIPAATDYTPSPTKTISTLKVFPLFDAYDVYVKDRNGCVAFVTKTISLDPMPAISLVVADQCPDLLTGNYTITATATTFNDVKEYSLDGDSFQDSNVFTVSSPGDYTVTVRDANQCVVSAATPVTILEPLQLQAEITITPTCLAADGEVTLTASGGTIAPSYEYSTDGMIYAPTNVFPNLAPNTYTFYVRDTGTMCVKQVTVTIDAPNTDIDFSLSATVVTCNGGNDGTILVTLATPTTTVNNNPIYTYRIDGGAYQESNLFEGLAAGSYTVEVLSGKGCTASAPITVGEPDAIRVTVDPIADVQQFGCTSGTNAMNFATITVPNVTGGSGVYTIYEFFKGSELVQRGAANSYIESDLLGGSYTVTVYDDNGCRGATDVINNPIIINPFISLDKVNVAVTTPITCTNEETIEVTVAITGGTPAAGILEYTVTGLNGTSYNATNFTGIFTNLVVGQYQIDVLNTVTGCSIAAIHYVNNPNTFILQAVKISDVVCYNSNEGTVELTLVDNQPADDAGPFDYVLTNTTLGTSINGTSTTAGPWPISGLYAGLYTVTAKLINSPECSVTTNFTIAQPATALEIKETHTEITCVPGSDGSISVTATGGWGDYQYELVGPISVAYGSQTYFTNLPAGSYTVNVKDAGGCVKSVSIPLNDPMPIVVTAVSSTTLVSCIGDKSASITATVSLPLGGQGSNYLYTLNYLSMTPPIANGPQALSTFTGLGAGTYSVTVTDGWGCSGTSNEIIIREPTRVEASLALTTSQTCFDESILTLTATGGTVPYTYSTTSDFLSSTPMVGGIATISVPVGTYRYYVRDANGCISFVSNGITIDPLPALTIALDYVTASVNCTGDSTGVIVAKATGGLGNYVYTLQDASGSPIAGAVQTTPGNFTQLGAGTYRVHVQSDDCTETSAPIRITEPATALSATAVPTQVTCNGLNNGKIVVTATGGTGTIKYAISPNLNQFFDTGIFENLAPGSYDIITQDQNGCYIYETGIIITEPTPIVASVIPGSEMPEICFGDNDGAFSIIVSGGTAPYSVRIDAGTYATGAPTQDEFDFTGLTGGLHTVYIRDANFCSYELEVILPEAIKLDPKTVVDYGCDNNAPSLTVTVSIDPSADPTLVDYALDGGSYQQSNVFANVAPGIHHITARHLNGCEKDTPFFTIDLIEPLTLILTDGGLNEIVATTTGGVAGYQYTLNGEPMGSKNKFIYYKSDEYTVTVTDANGCVATATRYFEFIDIEIPNVFTPNGDGDNDGWRPEKTFNYPDLVFYVFDRYGRKVGTYREGQSWDGKYNGNELPTGDYWYVIKLRNEQDAREFVGHFTLYR